MPLSRQTRKILTRPRTTSWPSTLAFVLASCGSAGKTTAPAAVLEAGPPPAAAAVTQAAEPAPDLAGTRTVIDLATNLVHATSHRDGRFVADASSIDFLKYVDGGWKTSWLVSELDEGKPAGLVNGLSAMFFVPLDTDGDGAGGTALADSTLSLTMRALAPKQRVSIFVNEKPVSTIEVEGATRRYDVAVPAAALKLGDNRVRLTFKAAASLPGGKRSAAAVKLVAFGPSALGAPSASAAPAIAAVADVTAGGARRRAVVPGGASSRVSYYVQLPEAATLAVGYAAQTPGAKVLVRVAVDGQRTRTLHEGQARAAWTDVALPLGAASTQAARIDLVARGGDVAWAEPRVVVSAPPPSPPPKMVKFDHIYIWMVDTLRADKVHVFNPKTRVQTPNYDAFAADATRFAWAQVPGTWSLPSHASLLTGVYPTVHKAVAHEARLSRDVPFVAEDMKKAGYRTGMFSSNGYVSAKWGFDRGWDVDRNFIRESLPNGAEYLWKTGKAWILPGLKAGKRDFVYLATVEPHVIYNPPKSFLVKYWDKPYSGPIKPALTGAQLGSIKLGKLKVNDTDKAYLEALHDAEITQSDAAFKTFIDDLKAAGVYDKSVVVVVSDHGDQFWEHGSVGHGDTVYQELTHVPLIIRAPGLLPAGHVVQADVEITDVYATMLALAGITPLPIVEGTSLVPLVFDEIGGSPRAALTVDGQVARGMKEQRYRLVHYGPGRVELYDEVEDRREQKNVAAERPIALRQMRGVLGLLYGYETRWNKTRWGTAANVTPEFVAHAGLPGHKGPDPKAGPPP
ncbi:MAG TPA: sulfatase [Polyangia bacterium]|nr:sulfatase [Polyangia bacterium]